MHKCVHLCVFGKCVGVQMYGVSMFRVHFMFGMGIDVYSNEYLNKARRQNTEVQGTILLKY